MLPSYNINIAIYVCVCMYITKMYYTGCLETVRPMPNITLHGRKFIMCWNITLKRQSHMCPKRRCTYAHTKLELRAWNRALKMQAGSIQYS